jgi:hypothetical protein
MEDKPVSTTIDQAFIGNYIADVHLVFQREGSMLRAGVFTKDNIIGSTAYFEKLGTGTATTKSRHGEITPMNATHTQPSCTIVDFYAGDFVDLLDEAKTNIDARMAYARSGAYALGRKVDSQITTVLDSTTQSTVSLTVTSASAIQASLLTWVEALDSNSVPNDGQRYGALTPRMWAQSMTVNSFASSDFVGPTGLPYTEGAPGHQQWKDWMGVKWCMHPALPGKGTATAKCFVWHKSALGHATGKHAGNIASNGAVGADITWQGTRAAHWVNHMMSGEACMIDDTGVIEGNLNDTTAVATA